MHALDEVRRFNLYGEVTAQPEPDWVHVEPVETSAARHNWDIVPHCHPDIVQLVFLKSGSCSLIADGEKCRLDAPSLILVPCDAPHGFLFETDALGWVLSLARNLFENPTMPLKLDEPFSGRVRFVKLSGEVRAHHASLLQALFTDVARRGARWGIQANSGLHADLALVFSLMEELLGSDYEKHETEADWRRSLYLEFLQQVEKQFRSRWSIPEYADAVGCSQATLNRICRAFAGVPPGNVISDRRMLEARRSLSLTGASIKQIACDLGFDDPAYFARSFKRHAGMTAREFRRTRLRSSDQSLTMSGSGR